MLKASIHDIPLLAGYLHDAYFKPMETSFNRESALFTMPLTRVWYERGQRGKLCFIMPVIRYPWIRSLLTITGVTSMCHKWKNRSDGSDDVQLLLDLATKDENSIELWSGDMSITLTVCPPVEFKIRDEAEMNAATRLIDFGTSIFYGLDEIEKLRIEDRQAGT